ncbi:MAG: transglycosylase SLT domain-containing protein [Calditrichia bacterium]
MRRQIILLLIINIISVSSLVFASEPFEWPHAEELSIEMGFWTAVFTEYNSNQYLIHDSRNLQRIFQVVSFDPSVSEANQKARLKKMREELQTSLKEIADKLGSGKLFSKNEQQILKTFGDKVSPSRLRTASRHLRIQQGMREKFAAGLARSQPYLPIIRQVFREENLPEELSYLPHIESSFQPIARSYAGAAGMWQFMRATARMYMKVNWIIDQRLDPLISSRAAAKLLKHNYKRTGDWGLALTAYNYGLNGMRRAAEKHGHDYMAVRRNFRSRRFQFASRNFYPEFLTVVEIMRNVDKYFPEVIPEELPHSHQYEFSRRTNLRKFISLCGISQSEAKKLNPGYGWRAWRGRVMVPAGYSIQLPPDAKIYKVKRYLKLPDLNLPELAGKEEPAVDELKFTLVLPGPMQSKPDLAAANSPQLNKPGVEEKRALLSAANLQKWAGSKKEQLPEKSNLAQTLEEEIRQKLTIHNNRIKVFANETQGHIADWLNIPTSKLRRINRMAGHRTIYQGQTLKLDFSHTTPAEFTRKRVQYHLETLHAWLQKKPDVQLVDYKVNSGESLWDIATNRYGVPVFMVQYVNSGADVNRLYPGDIVKIPVVQENHSFKEAL